MADTARGAVESVRGVGNERASEAPVPGRSAYGPATRSQDPSAVDATRTIRRSGAASDPPVAVRAAEVAALQRWIAQIWPAIALGGGEISGGDVLAVIAAGLIRPALPTVADALLASSPILQPSGESPPGAHQGVAGASRSRSAPAPSPVPAAGDGGGIVYLIALASLLALLAFTVWREFDVALRPWQHRP